MKLPHTALTVEELIEAVAGSWGNNVSGAIAILFE
ncbi:protein of unknown function [Paenibacillus alvei]|uniref:Uncharacterized protein n=1 Tax=Paenibacillus alvei TaxID=44250 RepID=A0A383RJ66_PAEAL|nr:protein of unknown function [Paenibacillus alvei]